jgi:hypothetical protein
MGTTSKFTVILIVVLGSSGCLSLWLVPLIFHPAPSQLSLELFGTMPLAMLALNSWVPEFYRIYEYRMIRIVLLALLASSWIIISFSAIRVLSEKG